MGIFANIARNGGKSEPAVVTTEAPVEMRHTDETAGGGNRRVRSRTGRTDVFAVRVRVRLKTCSRIAELSQHEADGGEFQEGKTAAVEIFPVLGETAAAVQPSDRTLDDPTLG